MELLQRMERLSTRRWAFFLLLFCVTALFRMPTLFNDYYDADELAAFVQTREYVAGDAPGRDFAESKHALYHAIFKASFLLAPDAGWVMVRVFTIIIVFLTAVFVFFSGERLRGFPAGALGALLYAVLISSFNRHFMATNGEIVFNLPLAAAAYFLVRAIGEKSASLRALWWALAGAAGFAAAMVKFHGLIFFIFLAFFLVVYAPFWRGRFTRRYALILASLAGALALLAGIDMATTKLIAPRIASDISSKLFYAASKGTNPLIFLAKFVHRQGLLAVWHWVAWAPAAAYTAMFFKRRAKAESEGESALAVFMIFCYLLVFAGASRLYHHYFIACYPMLCLFAAMSLTSRAQRPVRAVQARLSLFILIPGIFFLAWNTKDAVIRNCAPDAFYHEGRALFWTRAALVGTFDDYLLPHPSYRGACERIRALTGPGDRIYVWGDGPYLYYFSGRRLGTHHMWPKTGVIRLYSLLGKGDAQSLSAAQAIQEGIVATIKKKNPALVIDTSAAGISGFRFPMPPLLAGHVASHYYFLEEVSGMRIYARRGFTPRAP